MIPVPDPQGTDEPRPRTFWIALVPGAAAIAFGIRGLVASTEGPALWSAVQWFVGGNLAVDVVVSPIVCGTAFLVARRLPTVASGPVQGALAACAVLGLVSYPFVRGYGVTPGEPSFLSRSYGTSVLVLWAAVWLAAGAIIIGRLVVRRRISARRP